MLQIFNSVSYKPILSVVGTSRTKTSIIGIKRSVVLYPASNVPIKRAAIRLISPLWGQAHSGSDLSGPIVDWLRVTTTM